MKATRPAKLASAAKHRNWQMILYPESGAENWREYLIDSGYCWIASPLHDKDVNDDGTIKKAHYHIIITSEGPLKYELIKEDIADPLGAVFPDLDNVVVVKDVKSSIDYLTHEGFEGKQLYSQSLITKSPSFNIDKFTQITEQQQDDIIFEIIDFIEQKNITELRHLVLYARYNNNEWFRVIKHKTIFINHYINSKRNEEKEKAAAEASD